MPTRYIVLCAVGCILTAVVAEPATAQRYEENLEISLLGTVSNVHYEDGSPEQTFVSIPGGSPMSPGSAGLRIAHHHHAFPNLLEFGFSYQHVQGLTVTSAETAVGSFFGPRGPAPQAFIQGIFGVLHTENGTGRTAMYVGGQGGLRIFLKETVALRVQFGYRDMLGNEFRFGVYELGFGLGVLI